LLIPPPPTSTLFPYTTLFRSEHAWADLTVSVQAGCTIQRLQETLSQHGQRLALDPLWPEKATVGGVLSTNDSGALRLRFGALRRSEEHTSELQSRGHLVCRLL